MAIPLALFYYLYLILVAIFLLYTVFNLYHLLRFGGKTIPTLVIAVFYILFTIAILSVAWAYIQPIDWGQSIQLTPSFNRPI